MFKKLLSLTLAMLMVFTLCVCGQSVAFAQEDPAEGSELGEPITLVVAVTAAENAAQSEGLLAAKKYIEEKSNGNITLDCYFSASLFQQEEELAALVMGDADMCISGPSWVAMNSPWASMFSTGYLFKSYEQMTETMNGEIGKAAFSKIADEQGVLPLGAWYYGARVISLSEDKAINTPADLAGVNLRMPGSESYLFLGEALGANVTPLAFSELYLGLQTGVVDGQDNPLGTVYSTKFYEVQKSLTITNHLLDFNLPTISVDTWNKMTPAQQQLLLEGLEVGREVNDQRNINEEKELISFFEEEGLKIYYPDVNAFQEHVLNVYLEDSISDSWDMDLYNKIVEMSADY